MGVFTMHHWQDIERGLAEVRRVTGDRAVFLTLDLDMTAEMWLCRGQALNHTSLLLEQLVDAQRGAARQDELAVAVCEPVCGKPAHGALDRIALLEPGVVAGDLADQLGECELGRVQGQQLL
jgi:hypothetical protein